METPKVSVIVPAYDDEAYIEETLESILGQSLKEIEVILVDDGSQDGTLEIVRGYEKKDPRLRVFTQENSGASVARNRGAREARGQYLYFFDADDLLYPKALEILYMSAGKTDCDLIRFHAGEFYHGQKAVFDDIPVTENSCRVISKRDYLKNRRDYVVMLWQYFIRRDLWENLAYPFLEVYFNEDSELTPRLAATAKRIGIIKEQLHLQRIRQNSVSRSGISFSKAKNSLVVSESLDRFVQEMGNQPCRPSLHRLTASEVLVAISSSFWMDWPYRRELKNRVKPLLHHFKKSDRGIHRMMYYGFIGCYWPTAYSVYKWHSRMYQTRHRHLIKNS